MVPMELMKARPAAAPPPLRRRVGIGQKMARADVMPTSATVIAESPRNRLPVVTDAKRPAIPTASAVVRLPIFLPVRSTCQDHHNMPAEAKTYGTAERQLDSRFQRPKPLIICGRQTPSP